MNEELLRNIWERLTRDEKTTSSFEEWVVNVSNDPSVQQTIHAYLVDKKLTDSSFNDWADNTGLKKKDDSLSSSQGGVMESITSEEVSPSGLGSTEKLTAIERQFGKNEFTDFFGDIYRSWQQGAAQGDTIDDAMRLFGQGSEISDDELQEYIAAVKNMESFGPSDEMNNFQKVYQEEGEGVWGFLKGIYKNPTVIPQLFTSSVRGMLDADALAYGAAGAGAGALAGGATTGIGAVPGAIGGFILGASGSLETATSFNEFLLEELGDKDFTLENVREVISDPEKMGRIRRRAAGRGIAIGAIDAISGGIAGKATKSVATAAKAAPKLKGAAAGIGIESAGGVVGETAGRVVAGQEMDVAEIGFEGVTGTATAPLTVGLGLYKAPSYKINGERRSKADVVDILERGKPEDVAGVTVEIKNDPDLKKKFAIKKQDAIFNSKMDALIPERITDRDDRDAIIVLEMELKQLEGDSSRTAAERKKDINNELDLIYEKYASKKPSTMEEVSVGESAVTEEVAEGVPGEVQSTTETIETQDQVESKTETEVEVEQLYKLPETKSEWKNDFDIIDNRDGKAGLEIQEDGKTGRWYVENNKTGRIVAVTTKAEAQSQINNPTYDYGEGSPIITPTQEVVKTETEVTVDQEPQKILTEEEIAGKSTRIGSLIDRATKAFVDRLYGVRKLQRGVEKAAGKKTQRDRDFDTAEKLLYGKTRNQLDKFEAEVEASVKEATKSGVTPDQISDYLYALHAPERNKFIKETRDPDNEAGSGMTDQEAQKIIDSFTPKQKAALDKAADKFLGITDQTLQILRDRGLITEQEYQNLKQNQYQNYVPLKGFDEKSGVDRITDMVGESSSVLPLRGGETRAALGRKSKAGDVLSNIIQARTTAIMRAEKNAVMQNLLNLVQENPSEAYTVYTAESPDMAPKLEGGQRVMSPLTPREMSANKEDYVRVVKDGKDYFIKFKDESITKSLNDASIGGVGVLQNGIRGLALINNYLRKVFTTANPEFIAVNYVRDIQTGIINALADSGIPMQNPTQLALSIANNSRKSLKTIAAVERGKTKDAEGRLLGDQELIAKGLDPELVKYYNDFVEDGAKTGYFYTKSNEDIKKQLDGFASSVQKPGSAKEFFKKTSKLVDALNSAAENSTRLAAYMEARKAGVDRQKAASIAKDLTVNFNQKGELGGLLNSLFLFFNASVQGTARFGKAMTTLSTTIDPVTGKTKKKLNPAQKVAFGIVGGSALLAAMNEEMSDIDDDGESFFSKIPDYEKERNLIIMKPNGKDYIKIPLPYGYNVFYNMGQALHDVSTGNKDAGDTASFLTRSFTGAFSPLTVPTSDSKLFQATKLVTPSVGKPIIDLALNENFFGTQIFEKNFPAGAPKPESQLGRRTTPEAYKAISKWLNEVSGGGEFRSGSIDVQPEIFEYIVDQYIGGTGQFVKNIMATTEGLVDAAAGEEFDLETRKIPFARRFAGENSRYIDQSQYYKRRDEISTLVRDYKESIASGQRPSLDNKVYSSALALEKVYKNIDKNLKGLRETRVNAEKIKDESKKKRILKKIEAAEDRLFDQFNKTYLKLFKKYSEIQDVELQEMP